MKLLQSGTLKNRLYAILLYLRPTLSLIGVGMGFGAGLGRAAVPDADISTDGGQVKAPIYHLDMLLVHENKRALTEEEVEAFISAYIELCEAHGLWTSGGIYEDDEVRKT